MVDNSYSSHRLFLIWLIIVGAILFLIFLGFDKGYLFVAFKSDKSHITKIIAGIFLLGTVHCGLRLKLLCVEQGLIDVLDKTTLITSCDPQKDIQTFVKMRKGIAANYLSKVTSQIFIENNTSLINSATEVLIAQVKKGNESAWFMVDLLIKLGLLGTIIGFILMLGAISEANTINIQSMQAALKDMSGGMGTALYTTLLGLSASVLLSGQYLLMDKCADSLIERLLNITSLVSKK
jgi:hypothetical protein